jgi:polyhydroxyalkanoate synthase
MHNLLDISPLWRVGPSKTRPLAANSEQPFVVERYIDSGNGERILILPPIINEPWILDFKPEVSVVQRFCEQDLDVYIIRWSCETERDIGILDLVTFVRVVAERLGGASVFGYCTGGIVALAFTALHPTLVHSLSLLATPVDFSGDDIRILWGRHFDVSSIRKWVKDIPGEVVNCIGVALLYYHLPQFLLQKDFVEELTSPEAFIDYWRRLRWVIESPRIPGKAFEEFVHQCYKANLLIHNKMRIDGRNIDLTRITAPVLNIMAKYDHIVSVESAQALARVIPASRYEEILFPSSHVGLSVSGKAHEQLWPKAAGWIAHRGNQ